MLTTEITHHEYHNSFVLHISWQEQHEKIRHSRDNVDMIDSVSEHENLNCET